MFEYIYDFVFLFHKAWQLQKQLVRQLQKVVVVKRQVGKPNYVSQLEHQIVEESLEFLGQIFRENNEEAFKGQFWSFPSNNIVEFKKTKNRSTFALSFCAAVYTQKKGGPQCNNIAKKVNLKK